MLHNIMTNTRHNWRRLLAKLATFAAFTMIIAVIVYCATAYVCNQMEAVNRSAEHTARLEAEKAINQIIENSDRNLARLISYIARQSGEIKSDLPASDVAEELKAIRSDIDSLKLSINSIDLYSISQQLDVIENHTKHIIKDPSSLTLSRFDKTLDDKLDSIQMGIDAIDKSIFTLSLRISQL